MGQTGAYAQDAHAAELQTSPRLRTWQSHARQATAYTRSQQQLSLMLDTQHMQEQTNKALSPLAVECSAGIPQPSTCCAVRRHPEAPASYTATGQLVRRMSVAI
jgi:hypothetical protein